MPHAGTIQLNNGDPRSSLVVTVPPVRTSCVNFHPQTIYTPPPLIESPAPQQARSISSAAPTRGPLFTSTPTSAGIVVEAPSDVESGPSASTTGVDEVGVTFEVVDCMALVYRLGRVGRFGRFIAPMPRQYIYIYIYIYI